MRRFYCPSYNITQGQATITDVSQSHHIRNVLRLKPGAKIFLFDDHQKEYIGEIWQISKKGISIKIESQKQVKSGYKPKICLAVALPKRAGFDFIVEKLTELGTDTIIPLETLRTIVRVPKAKRNKVSARWQKIALNASQQARRRELPHILPIQDFKTTINLSKDFDLRLIASLSSKAKPLKETLKDFQGKSIIVFIGPEGDFSDKEIDLAVKSGCTPVSLGGLTLKVDTAAIAVLAVLNYVFTQMNTDKK